MTAKVLRHLGGVHETEFLKALRHVASARADLEREQREPFIREVLR